MLNDVCFFEIPADNLETLQKFYNHLFGWTFQRMPGPMDYYTITTGSGEPRGGMLPRQHPQHTPISYVMVESVENAQKTAEGMGAQVLVPRTAVPGMGWFAVLADPQNNAFGLWQDDPSAA
ncbi:MAG: VOC family protein [Desulfomonile tiedjei]|nr:VOC family protein [Desulfomonile tiedjei]